MSIPIDKLYHYIEGIARKICCDDIIIYRFYPHGSKKLEDLTSLRDLSEDNASLLPQIYCYDQEPLDYNRYAGTKHFFSKFMQELFTKHNLAFPDYNFCASRHHVYDAHLLIHSEIRSSNVEQYKNSGHYIPVYYWSHAIIAYDWFRYAQYEPLLKNISKKFLIYNRAWSGTREYRLKFVDLLIEYDLVKYCQLTINPIEPELGIHYTDYQFKNNNWKPVCNLEFFVPEVSTACASASADYELDDYNATEFEVVLETLFDDDRIQLTEKILRPIALGQPFVLASTHGSLEYLRSYGFRTFASIIDESYDTIENPKKRLEAIVKSMKEISLWTEQERVDNMKLANQIASYNRKHFFSSKFTSQVVDELTANLSQAFVQLETTNTGKRFIDRRKKLAQYGEIKDSLINRDRQKLAKTLRRAREYYNKH